METLILIITNSNDPTVDVVTSKFDKMGLEYNRLNTDVFFTEMTHEVYLGNTALEDKMLIVNGGQKLNLQCITGIWYRRPVTPATPAGVVSAQAIQYSMEEGDYFLRSLWKLLGDRKWVSTPHSIKYANSKLHQLRVARELGFKIPKSLATTDPDAVRRFYNECNGKIIIKPFATNVLEYGTEIAVMYTSRVTEEDMAHVDQVRKAISFFQEEVEKHHEIRVTVIGDDVFVARIDSQSDERRELDWRRTSTEKAQWQVDDAPYWLKHTCRKMVALYNLSYGAFDFAVTDSGEYVFFELNPNGQWAWQELELGYPMTKSLAKALGN